MNAPRRTTRLLAMLSIASALAACTTVHQTEHCVGTRNGATVEQKMPVGLNFTPIMHAECFTLTDQNFPANQEGKETIETQSRDPMTITGDIAIVYAFDPATVYEVFLEKRTADAAEVQVMNAVRDGYRSAVAGWYIVDLFGPRRSTLGDSVRAHIQSKLMTSKGPLAIIKNVYIRDIRVPAAIENARIAATQQALVLDKAQKQLAIDSMNARGQIITATANAEARRLDASAAMVNPKLLDVQIAQHLANICAKATTCILGATPNSLLGLPGLKP